MVERLKPYFDLPDLLFHVDSNMIWVISETEIPDEGDIEREDNNSYTECNKKTIIQQVCKLYKPSLWNNMGFGFVTPKQFKIIKNSTPGKLNKQKLNNISSSGKKPESPSTPSKKSRNTLNSISRDSLGYESEPETINNSHLPLKKRAISETMNNIGNVNNNEETEEMTPRPRKKGKFVEAIELNKNTINEDAIKNLPEPPPSVWRRGKRNTEEKAKIEEWENIIKGLGYSPVDYKRFVYLKRKENEKFKNEGDDESNEQISQLSKIALNESSSSESNIGENEVKKSSNEENTSKNNNDNKKEAEGTHEDDLDDVTTLLYAMSKNN